MESKQGIHVITLANSIIGVSILAMPYCFKQCGIILSIILLIFSSILSRLACHFLLKSAIKARLRTFEFLAYHVFGSLGKLFVEIGMIGFLIGTCIAFFVVMGDLSPQIVAHLTGTESSDSLRTMILIALGIFCVLPLGLLRNVDSLSGVCTATIGFYGCLVLKIMGESAPHILGGDWVDTVNYWRPAGILQCIPIFSMALFCQTQLFEIYQAIPNASLEKMNNLVRLAVNICTCVYIFVGIFGYIAISHEVNFTGNILMNFKPSMMTEVMKIGFVLSVAFSFPLVIFPCRASLYSLIYKPTYSALHESTSFYIPESKFRLLTFLIVLVSLIIGVLIPNIELVLGLVGSTIGVMICVLFPATCFICLTSKNTNERILAQIMLFIGIIMMVLGTYANLYAMEHVSHGMNTEKSILIKNDVDLSNLGKEKEKMLLTTFVNVLPPALAEEEANKEIRHEPPQPEAPLDEVEHKEAKMETGKVETNLKRILETNKVELQHIAPKPEPVETLNNTKKLSKPNDLLEIATKKIIEGEIDKEAIKKEDKELEQVNNNYDRKLYEEQHKLIIEQKKILNELKKTHEKHLRYREEEKEEKVKAVKNIETLARLAIETLVDKANIGEDEVKNEGDETLIQKAIKSFDDDRPKITEDKTLIQKAIKSFDSDRPKITDDTTLIQGGFSNDKPKKSEDKTFIQQAIESLDDKEKRIKNVIDGLAQKKEEDDKDHKKKGDRIIGSQVEAGKDKEGSIEAQNQNGDQTNLGKDKEGLIEAQNHNIDQTNLRKDKEHSIYAQAKIKALPDIERNKSNLEKMGSSFNQNIENLRNMAPIPLALAPNLNLKSTENGQTNGNIDKLQEETKKLDQIESADTNQKPRGENGNVGVLSLLKSGGGIPKIENTSNQVKNESLKIKNSTFKIVSKTPVENILNENQVRNKENEKLLAERENGNPHENENQLANKETENVAVKTEIKERESLVDQNANADQLTIKADSKVLANNENNAAEISADVNKVENYENIVKLGEDRKEVGENNKILGKEKEIDNAEKNENNDSKGVEAKNKRDESVNGNFKEENDGKNRKPDDLKNLESVSVKNKEDNRKTVHLNDKESADVKKQELENNAKSGDVENPDGERREDKIASNHRDILSADNYLRRKRDLDEFESVEIYKRRTTQKSLEINQNENDGKKVGNFKHVDIIDDAANINSIKIEETEEIKSLNVEDTKNKKVEESTNIKNTEVGDTKNKKVEETTNIKSMQVNDTVNIRGMKVKETEKINSLNLEDTKNKKVEETANIKTMKVEDTANIENIIDTENIQNGRLKQNIREINLEELNEKHSKENAQNIYKSDAENNDEHKHCEKDEKSGDLILGNGALKTISDEV